MKPLLIIGASSFGHLMAVLAEDCGRKVAGYVDDYHTGPGIAGTTTQLGEAISATDFDLVMAIGYKHLTARIELFDVLSQRGFHFPTLVHPRAVVSSRASIGDGCLLMSGVNVDAFTTIGDACVLWPGAIVSHDNQIGRNTFISPGATLCGFVSIGQDSFIGANCTIIDSSSVEDGGFVKAATRYQTKNKEK
ncbi:hypothetical protein K5K93_09975 [Stenotrophomonas sp. DR822]|uniref:PglD-related sugar-binding protein n=1 Tax=Stenotrophomonas sp. DR822 TaxID=2871174 RepID=UPI001C98D83A|nr:hypothetical protein [Stenotrophomonas sp. DR822]QZN82696.1 hypothetical protein K5K93_09975 [Stenotrophomonas sp. DR822]